MINLYITADKVGAESGGGYVTENEQQALKDFTDSFPKGSCYTITLTDEERAKNPFEQDEILRSKVEDCNVHHLPFHDLPGIAHCYAGCLTETIRYLKERGWKVCYTCAAHDKDTSKEEHAKWQIPFDYPHLIDPVQWHNYSEGYRLADVLVVPSSYSKRTLINYGCDEDRICIIPHGIHPPKEVKPLPKMFTVGYLGAVGADKGLPYLLEAWGKLAYQDALLVIAGKYVVSSWVNALVTHFCPKANVKLMGWVDHVSDFYNQISLYVQPSVTEGFGIEVLEAFSYERDVLCSVGAGASDHVGLYNQFTPKDVEGLCKLIDRCKSSGPVLVTGFYGNPWINSNSFLLWENIRKRYIELWEGLVA